MLLGGVTPTTAMSEIRFCQHRYTLWEFDPDSPLTPIRHTVSHEFLEAVGQGSPGASSVMCAAHMGGRWQPADPNWPWKEM